MNIKNDIIKKVNKYTEQILSIDFNLDYEKAEELIKEREEYIISLNKNEEKLKTLYTLKSNESKLIEEDINKNLKILINLNERISKKIIKELDNTKKDYLNKNVSSFIDFKT